MRAAYYKVLSWLAALLARWTMPPEVRAHLDESPTGYTVSVCDAPPVVGLTVRGGTVLMDRKAALGLAELVQRGARRLALTKAYRRNQGARP